jgi:hypothetical protein
MDFDLKLYSLNMINGVPQESTPGFFAATAPRRAARGRQDDGIIIHLDMRGDNSMPAPLLREWLVKLADVFFKTPGSVTSAMRAVIDLISIALVEQNLKLISDRDRQNAYLNLAVIHHNTLFIAQSGQTHAYWVGESEMAHFFDPGTTERGLGLTRTPTVRFYQHDIANGDCFISTPTPSTSWDEEHLVKGGNTGFDQLWRRLHHNLPVNMLGGLAVVSSGNGQVVFVPGSESHALPKEDLPAPKEPDQVVVAEQALPLVTEPLPQEPGVIPPQEVQPVPEEKSTREALEEEISEELTIPEIPEEELSFEQLDEQSQPFPDQAEPFLGDENSIDDILEQNDLPQEVLDWSAQAEPDLALEPGEAEKPASEIRKKGLRALSSFFKWTDNVSEKSNTFTRSLKSRLFPGAGKEGAQLSKGTMIAVAIIVPLLIVALAASVYITRGKNKQYDYFLAQAKAAAANAQLLSGTDAQRTGWQEVLKWSEQARGYRESVEVKQLIDQAQNVLDNLDGAVRLTYRPAIAGLLVDGVVINEIIPITNDLYLFDSAGGRVLHLTLGNQGYVLDTAFVCRSGTYSTIPVGNLVGMVSVPINNAYKAPIMAVDRSGNILYCLPGSQPIASTLVQPDGGFGEVQGIALDAGKLFLLDPTKNALWVYYGSASQFTDMPDSFFNGYPLDLKSAKDITASGDELYVLFQDGQMATCLAPGFEFSSINCSNPAPYVDMRENSPALDLPSLQFSKVLYVSPRDPSVMLLASATGEIYQFSSHLTLNRIYRSNLADQFAGGLKATAFGISSNRNVYLAIGNLLYWAVIP